QTGLFFGFLKTHKKEISVSECQKQKPSGGHSLPGLQTEVQKKIEKKEKFCCKQKKIAANKKFCCKKENFAANKKFEKTPPKRCCTTRTGICFLSHSNINLSPIFTCPFFIIIRNLSLPLLRLLLS